MWGELKCSELGGLQSSWVLVECWELMLQEEKVEGKRKGGLLCWAVAAGYLLVCDAAGCCYVVMNGRVAGNGIRRCGCCVVE